MDQKQMGSLNSQLTCDVCKINFVSNADHALHEFSKKHCDNLIRLAKNKPIITKQKTKTEVQPVEKEVPKVNTVTHTGSFAKYGYFVPGEIYRTAEISKEFNTDYDPYLQKYAKNPFKPEIASSVSCESQPVLTTHCPNVSFSKKKKKKIKSCQICNVTLGTVPEYEAHMKSPQHIWKLKATGMGVSAHFVKASTDLHTTDKNEDSRPVEQPEDNFSANVITGTDNSSGPFPLLYCSDCELLLNSPQQYNAHVIGKSHLECAQRKAELKAKKEKAQNPDINKLYCYSCKISLNNLFQYNEHKNGKKHKTKCKQLIRRGITIPPEERVPDLNIPKINPNKPVVYPELYEKVVLEKQKAIKSEEKTFSNSLSENKETVCNEKVNQQLPVNSNTPSIILSGNYSCSCCRLTFQTLSEYNYHFQTKEHLAMSSTVTQSVDTGTNSLVHNFQTHNSEIEPTKPNIMFHTVPDKDSNAHSNSQVGEMPSSLNPITLTKEPSACSPDEAVAEIVENENVTSAASQVIIVSDNNPVTCSICGLDFNWQSQLDKHLTTEDHLKKILELKLSGKCDSEILNKILSDRNHIKPDNLGRFGCSVCNVTTVNRTEFEQHLKSIVHKYTHKDYITKRTVEVKHLVGKFEQNLYFCKLCKDGWNSLLDYTQHLHLVKHKTTQRAERAKKLLAKKKKLFVQKQRFLQRRNFSARKSDKNPGVRTKICGVATDLCTGTQAPVPNLEPLEPKIDPVKNIHLGVSEKSNASKEKSTKSLKNKKRRRVLQPNKKMCSVSYQKNPQNIPPLIPPPVNSIPPLMPLLSFQFPPQNPRPNYYQTNRNWYPRSNPYPPPFGPFCGRSPPMSPNPRAPWSHRTRWPKYSSRPNNFY